MTQCSLCGRPIRTPSGVRGACQECGAPLCFCCVMIDGAEKCQAHSLAPRAEPVGSHPLGACATCGKWLVTAVDSAECGATGCQARLCVDCLAVGSRLCPSHAAVRRTEGRRASDEEPTQAFCGFCGARIEDSTTGVVCAEAGCDATLCAACVDLGQEFCGQHLLARPRGWRRGGGAEVQRAARPSPDLPLAGAPQWYERRAWKRAVPPPPGSQLIDSARARLAVESFLGRFGDAMARPRRILLPRGDVVKLPGWEAPTARWGQHARGPQGSPGAGDSPAVPANRGDWYEYAPRRWSGLGREQLKLLVEARSYLRTERYGDQGSDWEPIGAEEVAPMLADLSDQAREGRYFHLLCIVSPTGWAADARELIAGDGPGRGLALPGLRVVLCGPHLGDACWNEHDTRADELSDLFPLLTEGETDAALARDIEALMAGRSGIGLDEAISELGCAREAAIRVFEQLAEGSEYEMLRQRGKPSGLSRRGV